MHKSRIFLILTASFIAGTALRSFWEVDPLLWGILCVGAVMLIVVFYHDKLVLLAACALLMLVLGGQWTDRKMQVALDRSLSGTEYSGKGIIVREPEKKDKYLQIIFATQDGVRVQKTESIHTKWCYGDELEVRCILSVPENKSSEFDYRMYLAKDGVRYLCREGSIISIGENRGNSLYRVILNFREIMGRKIAAVIPQPEGALASGLLFGGGSDLNKSVAESFSRTGMTHIVAVSGYNVTIIAEYLILLGIFLGLWRKQAFWFALTGIVIFVVMVGLPASAVRAGVMGGLLLWAMKNGRLANSWNAIFFAAAVMLFVNPLLLRWDIGFQLSFLATIGIVTVSPLWEKKFVKRYNALGLLEIILLSISAQVFVIPLIMLNFHTFSAVSLLANLLVLPIVPLSMLLVFLTAAAGLISYHLSLPFAWLAYLVLKYEVSVIDYLASWRWSSLEIDGFGVLLAFSWYGLLGIAIYFVKRRKRRTIQAPIDQF